MSHVIQRLLPRHYRIMELALGGHGPKEIAQALGLSKEGVGQVMLAPVFQNELALRRERTQKSSDEGMALGQDAARKRLDELALDAVNTHGALLENPDPSVQQRSADSILRMVFPRGSTPSDDKGTIGTIAIITLEDLQLIRDARRESGLIEGQDAGVLPPVDGEVVGHTPVG